MALNHRIIKTVPRQAYDEIGDALGIRRNGPSVPTLMRQFPRS